MGAAVECAKKLVEHINSNYEGMFVRAYDEWSPRSGRIHFYFWGSSISLWVGLEERLREDPVYTKLLEQAASSFVEDSFDDRWMVKMDF